MAVGAPSYEIHNSGRCGCTTTDTGVVAVGTTRETVLLEMSITDMLADPEFNTYNR